MSNENEFKQETDRFVKGLENKLTDVAILASWATIEKNARRDKKCKGLKRSASSKCCAYCMSHEGTYTSSQVDAGAMGGRHEACKCKVTPVFEAPEFVLTKDMISNDQFGQKAGQHAHEFGLNVKSKEDRDRLYDIILTIVNERDEKVHGTWRDRPHGVDFYIKGKDVVVMDKDEFVTILENGVEKNKRVISARA